METPSLLVMTHLRWLRGHSGHGLSIRSGDLADKSLLKKTQIYRRMAGSSLLSKPPPAGML